MKKRVNPDTANQKSQNERHKNKMDFQDFLWKSVLVKLGPGILSPNNTKVTICFKIIRCLFFLYSRAKPTLWPAKHLTMFPIVFVQCTISSGKQLLLIIIDNFPTYTFTVMIQCLKGWKGIQGIALGVEDGRSRGYGWGSGVGWSRSLSNNILAILIL